MKSFSRLQFPATAALLGLIALIGSTAASYGQGFHVTVATSALNLPVNSVNAPFSVDFQLNSGNTLNNNTAFITNFDFGGGSPYGAPTFINGASGSLLSSVTLADTGAFNEFFQTFSFGSSLSFDFYLTRNVDAGPTPDVFSFAILDANLFNIATTGLGDSLVFNNLNGAAVTATGIGSYQGVTVSITPVPEPSTYGIISAAALGAVIVVRRCRKSKPRSLAGA